MKDIYLLTKRALLHSIRNIDSIILMFFLPCMILFAIGTMFSGAIDVGENYFNYIVPGILVLAIGYGAAMEGVNTFTDKKNGIINRFKTLPMVQVAPIMGNVLAIIIRNTISLIALLCFALLFDFSPSATLLEWLLLALFFGLYTTTLTLVSMFFGLIAKTAEGAGVFGFIVLFLPYISSAFVPIHTLPNYLHGFAKYQPFTPVIETIRGIIFNDHYGNYLWQSLLWLGGISILFLILNTQVYFKKS